MNELALSDDILYAIDMPARYIGGEINSVMKDKAHVDVRFCMCFPDIYEIGMSHLGIQILYDMFNRFEDTWCERVYSPWTDLDAIMRKENVPLFALESQDPIRSFDFLGITLQYEMCYTNILQILELGQIPLHATDRTWEDPIVIGGGPCSYNPEPISDFFDIFYMGEGETEYRRLLDLYKDAKKTGMSRRDFLLKVSEIPCMYVPMNYTVSYKDDGTLKSFEPINYSVPKRVKKTIVTDMDQAVYPTKPVIPFVRAMQDRIVLEIQRGCIRGCRFCQAGQIYKPIRERSVETLKAYAQEMMRNTGYEELSLSSLSSSDYTGLPELLEYLIEECSRKKVNISLPSLRIDAFSLDVMNKVQDVRRTSLTFAPEAGSQRMRNIINKNLTVEDILGGAKEAFLGGWNKVKLYFMLGLPFEKEEDIKAIPELANEIAALYYDTVPKEQRQGKAQITISTSFFVPKPFTAFQWAPQDSPEDFIAKAALTKNTLAEQLNQKSIKYNWHEADVSMLEGVLARGDRKLNRVIETAYRKGCLFDAWGENYHHELWLQSFEECGIDPTFYTTRVRSEEELFPWDFIDCGVTKSYLLREYHKAMREETSENCKNQCQGCGCASYMAGICLNYTQK